MRFFLFCFLSVLCSVMCNTVCNDDNCASNDNSGFNDTRSRVLSRRKRFLIFPDGTSFQLGGRLKMPDAYTNLFFDCVRPIGTIVMAVGSKPLFLVFCCQTAALIPIGDIFLFGNTAGLAWNLPTDPEFLLMFKNHDKLASRRVDSMNVYYVDEAGKLVAKVPYRKHKIVNPAFAKRSIGSTISYKEKLKINIDRKKMHQNQVKTKFLDKYLDMKSIEFHRSSRVGLLEKIEGLITALGDDGRQCVLRKLCETRNIAPEQGAFLEELLRVVFTLPKGNEFELEQHKEYDKASSHSTDCAALYPGCDDFGILVQL